MSTTTDIQPPQFKWRTPSKVVAIIDLIVSSLTLTAAIVACAYLILYGDAIIQQSLEKYRGLGEEQLSYLQASQQQELTLQIILLCVIIPCELVMILAAARFLGATKAGINASEALRKSRCYRILITIFFVFCFMALFGPSSTEATGVTWANLILRFVSVVVVAFFMKELDAADAALSDLEQVEGTKKEDSV